MWTKAEIQTERAYLIDERLGILCAGRRPTASEVALATKEADEWEKRLTLAGRHPDMDLWGNL